MAGVCATGCPCANIRVACWLFKIRKLPKLEKMFALKIFRFRRTIFSRPGFNVWWRFWPTVMAGFINDNQIAGSSFDV